MFRRDIAATAAMLVTLLILMTMLVMPRGRAHKAIPEPDDPQWRQAIRRMADRMQASYNTHQ